MFRSPEREAFLRAALRSLRPGRARDALERELRDHMDDAAEAYRAQGLPPEEAEARAVASMGDPKALARQIRQAHRPAAPVGALVLLAVMGAASAVLQTASQGPDALASRLLALALGGALGAAALCLDARRAARWAAPLLGGLFLAFLAVVALTPRISGSYPPVDALAALLVQSVPAGLARYAPLLVMAVFTPLLAFFHYHSLYAAVPLFLALLPGADAARAVLPFLLLYPTCCSPMTALTQLACRITGEEPLRFTRFSLLPLCALSWASLLLGWAAGLFF